MEPLRETREALAEMRLEADEAQLVEMLGRMGEAARAIVPDLVGLSLGLVKDRLTFTLVASGVDIARLDAAQYLDGGPCLRDDDDDEARIARMHDPLDEERWSMFARASAAAGVASSLSLPVLRGGVVIGGINLYASAAHAFEGHIETLATTLGGDASAAVSDADLSFSSRREAALAPVRVRDRHDVDTALGVLAARFSESIDDARARLSRAAVSAGVSEAMVARLLIDLHGP